MKIGDLVQWYTEYSDKITLDFGLVQKIMTHPDGDQVFIVWQTGDGDGWFSTGHPSIGVVSESR
tara:strand:+ start:253 stop:444 length:192 start_codon:yes stop_codon:yes gene_type:complete